MKTKTIAVETDMANAKKIARRKVADLKSSIAHMEHKAGAANGVNERRIAGRIDLTPQITDVDVHQIRLR